MRVPSSITVTAPELYWLPKVSWQVFGHLTFRDDRTFEEAILKRFFPLVYQVPKATGRPLKKVLWCLRRECRLGGNVHLHFCMGGLGKNADIARHSKLLRTTWRKCGGGINETERYIRSKNGIGYILKELDRPSVQFRESAKFVWGNGQVMISHSVWGHLRHRFSSSSAAPSQYQEVSAER